MGVCVEVVIENNSDEGEAKTTSANDSCARRCENQPGETSARILVRAVVRTGKAADRLSDRRYYSIGGFLPTLG